VHDLLQKHCAKMFCSLKLRQHKRLHMGLKKKAKCWATFDLIMLKFMPQHKESVLSFCTAALIFSVHFVLHEQKTFFFLFLLIFTSFLMLSVFECLWQHQLDPNGFNASESSSSSLSSCHCIHCFCWHQDDTWNDINMQNVVFISWTTKLCYQFLHFLTWRFA